MWLGTLVSNFGALTQAVAAAWLMTSLTPSADMVALVQAAMDSFDRRQVMIAAQGFMLAVSAVLALLAW